MSTLGEQLIGGGTVAAAFAVALAVAPGGANPFGPAKALVLVASGLAIAIGFALQPSLLASALRRAVRQRGAWPAFALLGCAVLATALSVNPEQSLVGHYPEYQGLALLILAALTGLGSYALSDARYRRTVSRAAVVVVVLVSGYALVQLAGQDPLVASGVATGLRRAKATLGNASNLGVFLCMALPLVIGAARCESRGWRGAAVLGAAGGGIVLAASLSRGAWLGATVACGVWLLAEGREWNSRRRIRVALVAFTSALVLAALISVFAPAAVSRVAVLSDTNGGTAVWRVSVWRSTAGLVAERPALGYGPASFRYVFAPRRTPAMLAGETGTQALDDPHNIVASTAVSAGVVAALALVWLLAEAVLAAWRRATVGGAAKSSRVPGLAVLAALVGGVVALQFHFSTLDTAPLLALLIGSSLAVDGHDSVGAVAEKGRDDTTSPRSNRAARTAAILVAIALAVFAVAASGLVLADRQIAHGATLAGAGEPWPNSRLAFVTAERLAPWEPATSWALGRGATASIATRKDLAALADGRAAYAAAVRKLPSDPLVAAQAAELLIVAGTTSRDAELLNEALPLVDRAIALDPANGYRWELRGIALAGLGQPQAAVSTLERAVQYSPNDARAFIALADVYDRLGRSGDARIAREKAAALAR